MLSVVNPVVFDPALLHKYNQPLPRYTSYPPATEMKESFSSRDFEAAVAVGNYKQTPLSLYCHIPFCESACYFCGCNTVITRHKKVADPYLDYLERNIAQVAQRVSNRQVNQLHWGGGTPSYLTKAQVERLWTVLHQHFEFEPEAEISIEVNPRDLDRDYVQFLRDLGFKRVSFGLQDFNLKVQAAVGLSQLLGAQDPLAERLAADARAAVARRADGVDHCVVVTLQLVALDVRAELDVAKEAEVGAGGDLLVNADDRFDLRMVWRHSGAHKAEGRR